MVLIHKVSNLSPITTRPSDGLVLRVDWYFSRVCFAQYTLSQDVEAMVNVVECCFAVLRPFEEPIPGCDICKADAIDAVQLVVESNGKWCATLAKSNETTFWWDDGCPFMIVSQRVCFIPVSKLHGGGLKHPGKLYRCVFPIICEKPKIARRCYNAPVLLTKVVSSGGLQMVG